MAVEPTFVSPNKPPVKSTMLSPIATAPLPIAMLLEPPTMVLVPIEIASLEPNNADAGKVVPAWRVLVPMAISPRPRVLADVPIAIPFPPGKSVERAVDDALAPIATEFAP